MVGGNAAVKTISKSTKDKSFLQVLIIIRVHAWETRTHAKVNLCETSTYKSCWRWSVSQFSTCMSLMRLARAIGFEIPRLTVKCTLDQMNEQFVLIMASKLPYITARCDLPLNRNGLNFPWLLLKFPDLLLFVTGKRMNFRSMATISHTNILRKSEILIFFSNNRVKIGGYQ